MVPTAVTKINTMNATRIINPGINKSSHIGIPPKILPHNNILLSNNRIKFMVFKKLFECPYYGYTALKQYIWRNICILLDYVICF